MRKARSSALQVVLLGCTLAITSQAFAQEAAPTWDRQVGLLIMEGQQDFIAQLTIEIEIPSSYSLVGEPTSQLPVPAPGQSRPWIRSTVLPDGRTLVSLDARFSPPIQIPALPLIVTLRMPQPAALDGYVGLKRLGAFRPNGELINPDDLGWDLIYQSSPDGVYEPLH
jgi:hypothetical protein